MVTPELLKYIQDQRAAGATDDQLRQALSTQGWFSEDINTALVSSGPSQAAAAQPYNYPVGESAVPPTKGWSWGAFGLTWIWGIRFKVWLAFLTFIPGLSLVWTFVLGFKGREWAWKNKGMAVDEELAASLKRWDKWGFILLIVSFLATGIIYFFAFQALRDTYLQNINTTNTVF